MDITQSKAPQAWCAKCDNRHIVTSPTVLNACGICYYHTECFRSSLHCECGFPTTKLIEIGKDCMACRRSTADSKLFCALHDKEAIEQLYLYARRGIDCADGCTTGCTPLGVFQGNGLLHPKIAGDVSRTLARNFALEVFSANKSRFSMDENMLFTVPGRVLKRITMPATSSQHNVLEIATEIFGPERAAEVVAQFKKEFPQYSISSDGTVKASRFSHGISSIIDDASLIKYLERVQNKAHAIAPLIAQYPGAAKKLCSLLDSDEAVLVQSTGIIYLGKCKPKVENFSELWSAT